MRKSWVHVALAVALLSSACNGGDSNDEKAVQRAMEAFESSLVGQGFLDTEEEDGDDEDEDDLEFESENCQQFNESFDSQEELPGESASEESPTYERGEISAAGGTVESVQGNVGLVDDEATLEEFFAPLRDERLAGCLAEAMSTSFQEEAAQDDVPMALENLSVTPGPIAAVGDEAINYRMTASVAVAGISLAFSADFVIARRGRAAVLLVVFALGESAHTVDIGGLLNVLFSEVLAEP